MITPRALMLAASLALCGPVFASGDDRTPASSGPTESSSLFLGLWELDLSRLPDNYGPPPKRVTYSFEDVGNGTWLTRIDITAPDGAVRHVALRYRRDGKATAGEGDSIDGDSAALKSPAPDVLVMSIAKDRRLGSVRVYAISDDGREMTESAAAVDGSGTPFVRNFHYRRIGERPSP